jgi:hypothetical protein
MRNILTISKRELTRLRSRVGGNMRATFLALAVGALALALSARDCTASALRAMRQAFAIASLPSS